MTGQLQIIYKNGEVRRVNLNKPFFSTFKIPIAERALDIAHSHNPEPWKIFVFQETLLKFEKVISGNEPYKAPAKPWVHPLFRNIQEKRALVKKFKKEIKVAA